MKQFENIDKQKSKKPNQHLSNCGEKNVPVILAEKFKNSGDNYQSAFSGPNVTATTNIKLKFVRGK